MTKLVLKKHTQPHNVPTDEEFNIVPQSLMERLRLGRIKIINWHKLAWESDEQIAKNTDKDNSEQKKELSLIDKINNYLLKFSRVPLKEKLFFVQHLNIMLKAGISLSRALYTLSEQSENLLFKSILKLLSHWIC